MSYSAIKAQGLAKEYVIGGPTHYRQTFREMLSSSVSAPLQRFRRLKGNVIADERFWALNGVDFEIRAGEVVGIIGRNGAGKTTLLKILSRITQPTKGRVEIKGKVASLLEVGTGFHPELTGRENIFLNGAILGMTRQEIQKRFDEMVAFAEVEKFLDTPVKRYSSGMYVRLAFAVAAHLDPDVLLVDEVLAVGDANFQKKCLGKMNEVSKIGRTVLFVSHNQSAMSKLCKRGLVLESGRVSADTTIAEAIRIYAKSASRSDSGINAEGFIGELKDKLTFTEVSIGDNPSKYETQFEPERSIRLCIKGEAKEHIDAYRTTIALRKDGHHIVSLHDAKKPSRLPAGQFQSQVEIPPYFLSPGIYTIEVGGYSVNTGKWLWGKEQANFEVLSSWSDEYDTIANMGLVCLPFSGRRESISS